MSNKSKQSDSIDLIESFYPEHRVIPFTLEYKEQTRPSEGDYSNERAARDAWLGRIVSSLFKDFLTSFLQETGSREKAAIWQEKNLPVIWEFFNDTALTLGEKRIVIIPNDNWNTSDFIIPAELIKIPELRGDYYVAIQVNLDEMWIRIWGYATYEQIKAGRYDSRMRNYRLTSDELNSDIYAMLERRQEDSAVNRDEVCLSVLSPARVSSMMAESAHPSSFSPRYKFDIEDWCAFIADEQRRNELYQKRKPVISVNIKNWFEGIFEDFCQSINEIIHPDLQLITAQTYGSKSELVASQKIVKSSFPIFLGERSIVLQPIVMLNVDQSRNLLVRIYSSVDCKTIDLPLGLEVKVTDSSGNNLAEQVVQDGTGRIECSVKEIKEGESITIKTYLQDIKKSFKFQF